MSFIYLLHFSRPSGLGLVAFFVCVTV